MTPAEEKHLLAKIESIEAMLLKIANPQAPKPDDIVVDAEAIKALARKVASHGRGVLHDFNARRSTN